MAKKLTPEQEEEFAQISTDSSNYPSEDAFVRNLSNQRDNDLLLSPELKAFFGKEFSDLFFRR